MGVGDGEEQLSLDASLIPFASLPIAYDNATPKGIALPTKLKPV